MQMIQSLLVYSIAVFILTALARQYKNSGYTKIYFRHPLIIGILLFYTLLCAVRYNVGVDYPVYLHEYERYKLYTSYEGVNNFEPGWAWFSWLLSTEDVPYPIYFGIIAFFQFFFLLYAFRKRPYLLPGVIIAFFVGLFFLDFQNVIRQNLVMSVFLAIVMNKEDIGLAKCILLLGACYFIHRSVLIVILLIPFIYMSKPYKYEFVVAPFMLILCAFVGFKYDMFSIIINNASFIDTILNGPYAYYMNEENISLGMGKTMGVGFLIKCLADLLLISNGKKLFEYYHNDDKFIICYRFLYIGKCLSYLVPTSMVLGRPLLYLTFFYLPLLAYFFHYLIIKYKSQSSIQKLTDTALVLSLCVLFFAAYFLTPEGYMSEFHFIWEN